MDPVTASAIAQGVMGIVNTGMGIHDRRVGKRMLKGLDDPIATIPDSATEELARTKYLASSFKMPGQDYLESMQDQILSSSMGEILNNSSSSSDAMNAIVAMYGKRLGAQNEIGFRAADNYMQREGRVTGSLRNMAEEEKRLFDLNQMNPFLRKLDQANSMINNGNNLISGGTSQVMSAFGGYAKNKALTKSLGTTDSGNYNAMDGSNPSNPQSGIMMDDPIWDYTPSESNENEYMLPEDYFG